MHSFLGRLTRNLSQARQVRVGGRSAALRFPLRVETLEDRAVPAGIVNASLSVGVLTITGVNDPSDVNLLGTNNQSITLDGAGGGTITVVANDGETGTAISGSPFSGVTSIKLVMGLGNDTVVITDTSISGTINFQGGSGNNTLFIDGVNNFSGLAGASPGNNTLGSVNFSNGDGLDTFRVGGGTHAINGNLTINNNVGGSVSRLGALAADVTTVGGSVKITNLAGSDTFETKGATATLTGAITINNGNGGSVTEFGATTNTLLGGISVTNAVGDDDFITDGTTFTVGTPTNRRNITISNGTGISSTDQNFNATNNIINGNISVTATAGDDDFNVNGSNFTVLGTITINVGNGGSTTSISPAQIVDIDGAVTVTAAEGTDSLDFNGATSVDLLSVSLSTGTGNSNLTFNGIDTEVTGSIRHVNKVGSSSTLFNSTGTTVNGSIISTHGDGLDTFHANGTNFAAAAITLLNGSGGSNTIINATNNNTITGAINITNGDGNDGFTSDGSTWTLGSPASRQNLTISNGNGRSISSFNGGTTTINGSIRVTNADGDDVLNITPATSLTITGTGSLTISNGTGGSNTSFDTGTIAIGGNLSITAGDGNDTVNMLELTVNGASFFSLGNGEDTLFANNSTFAAFNAAMGTGADLVAIENNTNDGINTVFNGAVSIDLGAGDDQLLIGVLGDANDIGDFNAAVTFVGGLDLDIIRATINPANTFASLPTVSGFEQGT